MEEFKYDELGFTMEIPAGWERLDTGQVKKRMAEVTEKSEGKDVSGSMDRTAVFLTIKGPPSGHEMVRPTMTCSAMSVAELTEEDQIKAAEYGLVQSRLVYRADPDNVITEIEPVELVGVTAKTFNVAMGDSGLGIRLVGFVHRDHAIVCGGGYDKDTKTVIEGSLTSVKVR